MNTLPITTRTRAMPAGIQLVVAIVCALLLIAAAGFAATDAGTVIKNQASASYRDTQGVRRVATSNVVETVIRQVAAIELSSDQEKPGTAGQEIVFAHTLRNTGNGPDTFNLEAVNNNDSDFKLSDLLVYRDDDRDGLPDSSEPVDVSHLLAAGESQNLVVVGVVPPGTANGLVSSVTLSATSSFESTVTAFNTDVVSVSDASVVEVTKSISALSGNSPDGPLQITIHYSNPSADAAKAVTLIDALPEGMLYVANSGAWSVSGALGLTDNNSSDAPGIRYCAYDASCVGLAEADSDNDSDSTNQVTAIIESVEPGSSGYVEFQVTIANNLSAGVLYNTAELQYNNGGSLVGRINSNTVPFTINNSVAVVLNGSNTLPIDGTNEPLTITESVFGAADNLPVCQFDNADPDGDGYGSDNGVACYVPDLQAGNTVYFRNTVWNAGNSTDSFDITTLSDSFPTGTVFRLLQADAQTPLLDTNSNGIADTGPLPAGASYEIVLEVVLPTGVSGDNGGNPFEVTTLARSIHDASVSNTMLNLLSNITGASVDITNNAALGDAQAIGTGNGPEADPVSSVSMAADGTAVIDLFVNNTSAYPLDFSLSASIYSDFSSVELPEQWQLEFLLADEVVSNTDVIAAGDFVQLQAVFTLPADLAPSGTSIYFRARNEHHGVEDIKHDEIVVEAQSSLLLGINQEAQAAPGGTHVYNHTLVHTGNTDINDIILGTTDSLAAVGFSSALFEDSDGDGLLGPNDQPISSLQMAAGESKTLLVKVFAPNNAAAGQANSTELTVSWGSSQLSVTDITNISSGTISVYKEQALDNGCDGVLDSGYSTSLFSVEPGNNCVRYRLTAFNNGSESVLNVVVADATPTFTSYTGVALCSQSSCSVSEPSAGGEGDIIASMPALVAGDSVVVEFMVRID